MSSCRATNAKAELHAAELALGREEAVERAEKAEAREEAETARAGILAYDYREAIARAEKAEAACKAQHVRHLDTLTPIREAIGAPDNADTLGWLKVVLAERDSLRAELAALRAPAEGEPSDNDLRDVWDAGETLSDSRRALWRAGVAHERTRVSAFLLREAADYAKLRAEVERLRTFCGEARDMLRDMPWRRGGGDLVHRLDRAALGEP